MRHIQAGRFGDTSALRVADSGPPEPAVGQVRLRVHAAGVNPADTYILGGSYAFYRPSIPYTPGFDAALAKYGRIVVVGSRAPLSFTPRLTMVTEADIRGTALWNMSDADVSQATRAVAGHLAHGAAAPVIARSFPLEQAADAMNAVMSSRARGKVILDCS